MTEARDPTDFWKSSGTFASKRHPLPLKDEDILLLVSRGKINVKSINEKLNLKQSTLYYRINSLIKRGYLYVINKGKPRHLDLTISGFDYLNKYFPKKLSGGLSGAELGNVGSPVRVVPKVNRQDSFPFDIPNFRQTVKHYFQKIEQGLDVDVPYPANPLLLTRAHTIQYSFPITQQSKFLTYQCKTHSIGVLARKVWVTSWGDKVDFDIKPMGRAKGKPTWIKYYGTLFYQNARFFIMFSAKKVHVRFTVNFHTHPSDSAFEILDKLFWIKKELEDLLSINESPFQLGSPNHYYIATQIMVHYGLELEPLSIIADQMGVSLVDKGGRLLIDASNGIPELEGVHSGFSLEDIVWLFEEMIWKIRNRYSIQQAKQEINDLREEIAEVEEDITIINSHIVQTNNQFMVLQDRLTLGDHKINQIESFQIQQAMNLTSFSREVNHLAMSVNLKFEQVEEDISTLQNQLQNYSFTRRSQNENNILAFLRDRGENDGATRHELARELQIKLNSTNAYIVNLKMEGLIREEKVGRQRGRLFYHAPRMNFSREDESNV